jgi:hypothetical protein
LKVFEDRMLRIFQPHRGEVVGGWRRLHNEELPNLYVSQNIIWEMKSRIMRRVGHVACIGAMRNEYKILVGKLEGKRPLRRPRHRREDNIRMDLQETVGSCGLDAPDSG